METCKERINAMYYERMKDLTTLFNNYYAGTTDDNLGDLFDYGLFFDYVIPKYGKPYFCYQLSWGGPADEFRFYAYKNQTGWQLERVEYWFLDWFDSAHKVIATGRNFGMLNDLFRLYDEIGMLDSVFKNTMSALEDY